MDSRAFDYIPIEKRNECYISLLNDVYFFYHGIKPDENEAVITNDGNKWNMNKSNLRIRDYNN